MNLRSLVFVLIVSCAFILQSAGSLLAVDEKITPTNNRVIDREDKEFNNAMRVWYQHRYEEGANLLQKFVQDYPDSRWAAEAVMHIGCLCVYQKKYDEAKTIFNNLLAEHPNDEIGVKCNLRLGNIAEATADYSEAVNMYNAALRCPMTWDQYKYLNEKLKYSVSEKETRLMRINCGSVALAACLEAMGKDNEAAKAKAFVPDPEGDSFYKLQYESASLGVDAKAVEMTIDQLKQAKLPVIGHVNTNHFIAVLSIKNGMVRVKDSIKGEYLISLSDLSVKWTGKALTFDTSSDLQSLDLATSLETLGGCCGVPSGRGGCATCPGGASQGGSSDGGSSACGPSGCGEIVSRGRPTHDVWLLQQVIKVTDTPIWYNPGRGPSPSFTINYDNDYSSSGIFGSGSKSIFDSKVYFLPSSNGVSTKLSASITSSSPANNGSLSVMSISGFPTSGAVVVTDGTNAEVIKYTSTSENSFNNITRGANPISVDMNSQDQSVYYSINDLQVHREDTRELDYQWNTSSLKYVTSSGIYGELIDVDMRQPMDDTIMGRIVVITLRNGTKYYYLSANEPITTQQGRLQIIEDPIGPPVTTLGSSISTSQPIDGGSIALTSASQLASKGAIMITNSSDESEIITYTAISGNSIMNITRGAQGTSKIAAVATDPVTRLLRLTMNYNQSTGVIESITDANGQDTIIGTQGQDSSERVTSITLPDDPQSPTQATFTYSPEGFLIESTDAAGVTSRIDPYGVVHGTNARTTLSDAISAQSPSSGGNLQVASTEGLPYTGWVKIGGVFGEVVKYNSIDYQANTLNQITRINPSAHVAGTYVEYAIPSIGAIETPSMKTFFAYHTMGWNDYGATPGTELWATYERGPGESWPDIYSSDDKPTWGYAINSELEEWLYHYPTTYDINAQVWTGGIAKQYWFNSSGGSSGYNFVASMTDAEGNSVGYTYDEHQNRTATAGTGDGSTYEFDDHRIVSKYDTRGNKWVNTYDPNTKDLTEVKCYDSNTLSLLKYVHKMDYSYGLVTKTEITDPDNPTMTLPQSETSYLFDRKPAYTDTYIMHNTLATAPISTEIYLNDVSGFPTSGLVRVGTEIIAYSNKDATYNKLTGLTRAVLNSTTYNASVDDRVSAFNRQAFHYDETYNQETENRGFLTSIEQLTVDSTGSIDSIFTRYRYDGKGRRVKVIDANDNETDYEYDDLDRVTQVTNPDSTTKKTEYTCCHKIWEEDENGHRVYYVYDAKGRLVKEVQSGASTILLYPIDDTQTNVTVNDGSVLSSSGAVVIDNEIVEYSSNVNNILTVSQRGAQNSIAASHDSANAVGKVSAAVSYVYDPIIQNRKTGLIDPENHETTYDYYVNNKLKKINYPDGTWEQYTYDGSGNMIRKLSSSGIVINYTYDSDGKLHKESSM
ncbi:tetratricopeptide repeat protein [bacterium]|nr:tetratricopeptide repeat protein [bacterium]